MTGAPLRRRLTAVTAAVLAVCTAATATSCGKDADNPYGLISPGTIRVASMGDARPYTFADIEGNFTGFDVDLFTDVAHRIGIDNVAFAGQDFSAILSGVAVGMFDVGVTAIGITEERKQTVDFSDGYLAGYLTLLGTARSQVHGRDDLDGRRLGVNQGSLQEQYAMTHFPKADLVRFPDNNAGTLALKNGSIDAFFLDYESAKLYLDNEGQTFTSIEDIPSFDAPAGFAVAKDRPELRDALSCGLHQAMKDGTWQRLYEEYFPDSPMPEQYLPAGNQDAETGSCEYVPDSDPTT